MLCIYALQKGIKCEWWKNGIERPSLTNKLSMAMPNTINSSKQTKQQIRQGQTLFLCLFQQKELSSRPMSIQCNKRLAQF